MNASVGDIQLFTGNANKDLAEKIAKYVGLPVGKAVVSAFPDGETLVKIEQNVRGSDFFIVQPTCPPTNHHLMELLIMIDAARRASAARITAVLPFYGYARQDRKDQPRVPITAKLVANLLSAAGANRILTMDLHAQQIQGFFDIPVDHLYAAPVIYQHLKKKNLKDLVVVSPDVGGLKMAAAYAQMLGCEMAIVAKRRKNATETEALYVVGEVSGKNALIVDDITETAGTLCSAASVLKKSGAKDIYAAVTHAVLSELAEKRLRESPIRELITTNTTPVRQMDDFSLTILCVAELLGEAIHRIHSYQSVTSLFELNGRPKPAKKKS